MSINTELHKQVKLIKSKLDNKYYKVLSSHNNLQHKIDDYLSDWQHESRLALLQQYPFELFEQSLLKQEQLFQKSDTSLNQQYLNQYQKFCQENKLPFDKRFWQKELQSNNQPQENSYKASWQLMLNQWRKQLDQVHAEWYLQQLNERRKKILAKLEEWLALIEKLSDQLNSLGLNAGLWLDNSLGNLTPQSIEELQRWFNYLANDEEAKQIAELLGKIRQIEQSEKIELVEKTISIATPIIDVNSREEIVGLRLGKELEYILPAELALLSDDSTDILFDLKYLENKLMCFELQGIDYQDEAVQTLTEERTTEDEKLGPMILCVDTSGSMQGTPEHIAKAMTLFLSTKAKNEKRACFVINFSTQIETFEVNEQSGMKDLFNFLRQSFYGGTDVAPALRYALQLVKKERYEKADVLLISDFVMSHLPDDVLQSIEKQREKHNQFNSLVIGDAFMSQRLKTYFDHEWIYNPYSKNIQELVHFLKSVYK